MEATLPEVEAPEPEATGATPAGVKAARKAAAELVRASQIFAKEDRARTWRLLATTGLVFFAAHAVALLAPWWPLQLVGAVVAGLTTVRLFIFYHDGLHGALFADSELGKGILTLVGLWTLNPPAAWKQTHDYHHRHNAKLPGTTIGSYPVVTTRMWADIDASTRRWYRFARHPLNIALGYFTLFTIGMCLAPFRRAPREHWQGPAAIVFHYGIALAVGLVLGWHAAVLGIMLPMAIATAAGGYLFYAQHNFPDMELRDRKGWDFAHAAVKSSSMFDMSPLMHWFTGNIGYHHVHHLNHRIPFYRLPEAMAQMPELQSPGRTTWHPRDVWACLRLAVWDPEQRRMLTWDEVGR